MVYTTQKIFTPKDKGAAAFERPWIIAMVLVSTGTVLVEQEVGSNTNVWAKFAAAYTTSSPSHVVSFPKCRSRIRVTPTNSASYEVGNE